MSAHRGGGGSSARKEYKEGQRVETECGEEGTYTGTVMRVRENGTFDINFDDGDREKQVSSARICGLAP
jgi:hypothetical protein